MRSRMRPTPSCRTDRVRSVASGPNGRIDKRPAPAARPQQPRRSCFGRAAGDRRDGGAGMPAGGRVKVSMAFESNTDRPGYPIRLSGMARQHCASHDASSHTGHTGQPVELRVSSRITSTSRSPAGREDALSSQSRSSDGASAQVEPVRGKSNQQGAPQHLQHSFTARQIGTASNEAFASSSSGSFRFDKKEFREKKRRAACATQLFKRPGTAFACDCICIALRTNR